MATVLSTVHLKRMSITGKLLRSFSSYSQFSRLSTQTQPSVTAPNESDTTIIDPLKHPDFFGVHQLFTIKDLFDAKVHLGHKEGSLNDKMRPFIFGSRLGHLIFDLDQTAELLRAALNITAHIAFNDGIILFICRNAQHSYIVDKTAKECREFSHTKKWRVGTFTNSVKEFGAVTRLPDLCIFLSTLDEVLSEHLAVTHSAKMCIPTVGIVDSNCNPNLISYPIPGNDDSPSAIELYCKLFKTVIIRGKETRQKLKDIQKLYM